MPQPPLISIVIPLYKVEPYIEECLESVFQQRTQLPLEVVLVDDCGGDRSVGIALEVVKRAPEHIACRLVKHEHNRGLSAARNTGTAAAQGEYVVYLDSDDTLFPDAVEQLWQARQSSGADMVVGGMVCTVPETHGDYFVPAAVGFIEPERYQQLFLERKMFATGVNRLIRRDYLLGHHLTFREGILNEDELWSYQVALARPSVYMLERPTYLYRTNRSGSIVSVTTLRHVNSRCVILDEGCAAGIAAGMEGHPAWQTWVFAMVMCLLTSAAALRPDAATCRKVVDCVFRRMGADTPARVAAMPGKKKKLLAVALRLRPRRLRAWALAHLLGRGWV